MIEQGIRQEKKLKKKKKVLNFGKVHKVTLRKLAHAIY